MTFNKKLVQMNKNTETKIGKENQLYISNILNKEIIRKFKLIMVYL